MGQPCTWHLLCHFTVSFMGRYSLRLIIGVASPRPFADGFHLVPSAGVSGGAQIHPHPGLHCHLVVVEGGVGMQLGSGSCSGSGRGSGCGSFSSSSSGSGSSSGSTRGNSGGIGSGNTCEMVSVLILYSQKYGDNQIYL